MSGGLSSRHFSQFRAKRNEQDQTPYIAAQCFLSHCWSDRCLSRYSGRTCMRSSKATNLLPRSYFDRSTMAVARSLIGKYLLREQGTETIAGKIIETEAYIGPHDLACHASKGRTGRTEVLFGPPGIAYVYLIYGMYHCLNVVTEREGYPAAVLIRALEVDGVLIDGPGRLCRALNIDRTLNRIDLTVRQGLWFEDREEPVRSRLVGAHPRIGVDYAGVWAQKPLRFRLRTGETTAVKNAGRHPR